MNHLFFPNRPKPVIGKAGINRVRKIIKYEKKQNKSTDTFNNNAILHNNIPNPWFYNKSAADKVWDGLEKTDKERQQLINASIKKEDENAENENDPFFKIDKSTSKIRQLVESFNATDQEFLLHLMEILDDDLGIDNLDQQSILLEAKLRLATMIDEHVGNSSAQSHMLDSLRVFFNDYQQGNQNSLDNEMSNLNDFDSGVDSAQLANLINEACEKNEVCSEQASHIHKSIVDSFTRQMRDLRQEINTRDKQIENLQNQIEAHQKNRRNRRSELTAKKIKETNQLLSGAQRKICEQQTTINNLKSALNQNSEGYDSSRQIDGQLLTSPNSINEKSSNSARNEFNETDNENGSTFLSSDREIELMSKIHYLTEQVQSLKSVVSSNNKEIKELKFASIDLNNNYQALERAKKTADQTISGLTEKYEFMENMYKKKLNEANQGSKIYGNEKSENQVIADLRIEYENKIASIKEQARQGQQQALDIAEKRHRMQMNDMLKSLENSDQSAALSEVMKNQESSINEVTERHKKQIIELKNMNNEKIRALTKQYEAKLMDAFKQNDSIRLSLKDDIAASLLKQKIELESGFQKKLNSVEAFADDKVEKMRKKFQNKIDSVENLNKKLMTERDALRDAIEDAQIVIDIPTAEDELFDENEEEEEEFEDDKNDSNNNNNNNNEEDDDMKLFDQNLADQQIKKIKDEYLAMMNQQRENLESTKEWEIDQMKKEMMRGFEAKMVERRMNLVSDLTDVRNQVSNSLSTSEACEQLDNLISNLIKGVEKQSEITDDIINREPMIPLSEANDKMDELNKKLVQVSTENEFLRNTLGKLSNNRSLRDNDGNDVVKVMRQAVAEETAKINELLIENGKLKEELDKSKTEINELKEQKLELFKQNDEMKEKFEKEIELLKQKVGNLNDQNQDNSSSSFSGSVSLPIKPSYKIEHVSNDAIENEVKDKKEEEKIVCSNCGEKISLNPLIMQVSTVEKPIVECPFCHEVVQIAKTNEELPFPKEEFNQQQLEQIEKMENEIKNEVMNLIEMKKKMREGIDFSESKQVITVSGNDENKTITLTPNFDVTVFTLPPNPKAFSIKSQKNTLKIASARAFSPSNDNLFTEEQSARIQQIEGEIDKKINSLVDIKVKFTSSNDSRKGSSTNLNEMNDDSDLSNNKEIFFDSSEKSRDQIQTEIIKSSYSVVFELNPSGFSPNRKGRMIAASQSCDIYHGRRVSFSSNLIKPPHSKIMLPNNVTIQDKISDTQLKLTPSLKSKFTNGYGGTSLDGSQNPFSRPLSDLINIEENEVQQQTQPIQQPSKESGNDGEAVLASTVKSGFPPKEEITKLSPKEEMPQRKLLPSNYLQLQIMNKTVLSRSSITSIDIEPSKKQITEAANTKAAVGVMARIQSQLLLSQQQQSQQTQQVQQPLQQQQQHQQQQQTQLNTNENSTFLTPQADIVSLQLSEVGCFSRRNSRPSSEAQQRTSSPNEAASSTANSSNNPTPETSQVSDQSFGEKLFVNRKPIGEPRAIEEFVADLETWRCQTKELKDQYKSMLNSYNEVSSMAHDLVQRHNEVVKVLTKALDTAMSLAHGDAEHPEALIEKMQEQSAYLTTVIREKEVLHSQSNEHLLILNERVQEVMQMHGESAEKEQEIESLQKQLKLLLEKEKQNMQTIHELEQCDKNNKENAEFQKEQINSIADKLEFECRKNFDLQKETDALKVKVETLQTQLVIASKEPDVDMTSIEPFVIFSFDGSENSLQKSKGFGLQPKSSRIILSEDNNEAKEKEKEDEETNKEKENENKENNQENEVIHVASFKKNDSKLKDSSGSFSVFQADFTDSTESKVVYKVEDTNKEEETKRDESFEQQFISPIQTENSPENNEIQASKNDLSVTHPTAISGRVVESQKAQILKKRLKQLELALVEKVSENSEVKEELHTTQQHLFKLTNMNAKIEREVKKAELARDIAQRKLQSSIELITTLSTENESLRKLVEQYKQMAKKFAEDMKKASQFEESKNIALLNEMKTRSFLRDIQKVGHSKLSMKNIAERQAIAVARWEGKRRFMQQKERQKIFSALQALNLVHKNGEEDKENSESESLRSGSESESERERERKILKKKSIAPGLNVAVYNIKKKSVIDSQIIDANAVLEIDRPRSVPSYDEALKNANSHNQKVPKALMLGIVANPLKV